MERRGLQVIVGIVTIAVLIVLAAYDASIGRNTVSTAAVSPPTTVTAPAEAPAPPPETALSTPPPMSSSATPPATTDTQLSALPSAQPPVATPPTPPAAPSFDVVRVEPSGDTVIAGEAAPNSKVEILDGNTTIASVDTDGTGEFALPLDKPLAPGTHDLALKATNKDATVTELSDQRVTVSVPEPPSKDVLVVVNTPDSASKVLESGAATASAGASASSGGSATSVGEAPAIAGETAPVTATPPTATASAGSTPPTAAGQPTTTAEASPPAAASSPSAETPPAGSNATAAAAAAVSPPAASTATAAAAPTAGTAASPTATAPSSTGPTAVAGNEAGSATGAGAASAPSTAGSTSSQEVASAPSAAPTTTPANDTAAPAATGTGEQVAEAALPKEATVTSEAPIAGEPKIQGEAPIATEPPAAAKTEGPAATPSPPPPPQPSVTVAAVEADTAGNVYVAGTAATGETVRVYLNDQALGDAKPSPSGTWLVQTQKDMPAGTYDVRVDQLGADGAVIARAEVPFQREVDVAVLTPTGTANGATAGANVTGAMPPMETVIIKHGDNLWRIARSTWGHGVRWSTIYQANTDQIRNPHWIYPGQVFIMPKGNVTWTD